MSECGCDRRARGHPVGVTVVRVWEPHPPAGVEPLEWVLGTDRGGQSADDLLGVVAVRVRASRWQRDATPDAAAEGVASEAEVDAVTRRGRRPRTVREFVDAVARLGGYLGRASDGPPGWQSLWRGYRRRADIVLGLELAPHDRPLPHDVGNG
jgi:hypothetical protein